MKIPFLNVLRKIVGRRNDVDDALQTDRTKLPDFLRGAVSADVIRQVHFRFIDAEGDARQPAAKRVRDAGDNAICYLTADGAVFGPIGSSYRVRTRKHVRPLRRNDVADADEKS